MQDIRENRLLLFTVVVALSAVTVIITILSLTWGVHEVFPFLYLLPVILVSYYYPRWGVKFSLLLGSVYIALVYLFGLSDIVFLSISTAWFYVVISVGVVLSSLSQGMMHEEMKYKGVFNNSQSGIFILERPSMKLLEANRNCAKQLGYRPSELAGSSLSVIWPDTAGSERLLRRLSPLFCIMDMEVNLRDRHGKPRSVLLSASPIDEHKIVCSFVDITERKAIEESLLDSEIKFRNIVERSLAGVYMIQDDRFVYVNPKFAKIHGYTVDALLNHVKPSDLVYEADRWKSEDMRTLQDVENPGPFHYEIRHRCADRNVIIVERRESIVEYHDRPAVMGTLLDITESRKNRNALKTANEKLNLLGDLTRHDLLNQLTAVIGFVELAKEDEGGRCIHEYLSKAGGVLQRMSRLLQFTRDYQNLGVREPEWMDVRQTFTRAASMLDTSSVAVQHRVEGLQLYADPLLEKVFYNLIENSLRHGGRVTCIGLEYERREHGLLLVYTDNGTGIKPEEKQHLFSNASAREHGYGLFLCQQILSLTDMTIVERGEFGKGVCFEISVPRGNFRFDADTPAGTVADCASEAGM